MTILDQPILFGLIAIFVYFLGIASAFDAIMKARTSQGAIAWAVVLITLPYLALPLYWFFGQRKFHGYTLARRSGDREVRSLADNLTQYVLNLEGVLPGDRAAIEAVERLAKYPFTGQNKVELLIDGRATFNKIFDGIEDAQDYILIQFYIVRSDSIGRALQERLIRKAKAGVRVFFLYDEIGSRQISGSYVAALRDAGIAVSSFKTTKSRRSRSQLNFRNHRKIVVVDGRVAYVGGHNVGDEYLGCHTKFGPWRDTHVRIEGPAVQGVQLSYLEDWYWATHTVPDLQYLPEPAPGGDKKVLVLPSGPADDFETYNLFVVQAILAASQRLWIVSPYFVPDTSVMAALKLAALRGVDVRIMLPKNSDNLLVDLATYSYFKSLDRVGIKIYRYQAGFLHQKVLLIDEDVATVGTANMDNRSFRLNFEITIIILDRLFTKEVERMLETDFARSYQIDMAELEQRPFYFKVAVQTARLLAPVL
ncbi:cardiolipin synthase [Limibacillus sp. MBR-115]|jgi:cardiolipin synthase|uniref:cardiolipin synthase n=1 Tax=Limibacillus sp. MBR-115 TaxID=3156465 RepID=UPI003392A5C2